MIAEARTVSMGKNIETDVCIVGAGVAGITLARELIHEEFRVCLLEGGGLEPDEETQSLYSGDNVGERYYALDTARARWFGGSSNSWNIDIGENGPGVRLRPLDGVDFEEREWIPFSGWPFGKKEIDPYYQRAQIICQVEPPSYDVEDWEEPEKAPRLSFVGDRVKTIIYKFGTRRPFSGDSVKDLMRSHHIPVFVYANVVEIETNKNGEVVTRVRVACLGGNTFSVSARLFILAAGGLETPRLLLQSNKVHETGLGNQHDLVGRFFMEHLHFWSGIYVPSQAIRSRSLALYNSVHRVNQVPIIGKLALGEDVLYRERLLNQNFQLMPRTLENPFRWPRVRSKGVTSFKALRDAIRRTRVPEGWGTHLRNVVADIRNVGRSAYGKLGRTLSRLTLAGAPVDAFILANMTEQAPNPESRVTLSSERDSLGQNRLQLNWKLSPLDIRSAIRTQEILDEELLRAGLGRLCVELEDGVIPHDLHGGYHHMGTTRMHRDPAKGVVDENCCVHGTRNLFIAGPSVFPTGGYANPVLTIVALAVRLADHVKVLMKSR